MFLFIKMLNSGVGYQGYFEVFVLAILYLKKCEFVGALGHSSVQLALASLQEWFFMHKMSYDGKILKNQFWGFMHILAFLIWFRGILRIIWDF